MKYLKHILILFILITLKMTNVTALSCPNSISKDLSLEASHIKVSYEIIDRSIEQEITIEENTTSYKIPKFDFVFTIYNMTENLYITIKDDVTNENKNIFMSDTNNGEYTFTNSDPGKIYNYTFSILSNDPNCQGQKVRTIRMVKPKYNAYSEFAYCKSSSNYYCQRFVEKDLALKNSDDFLKAISVNIKDSETNDTKVPNNPKVINYTWINIAVVAFAVIIVTTIIIVIVKKVKARKRWEI